MTLSVKRHETAGIIDLVAGAARGKITQPLVEGTLANGNTVYFVLSDASDKDFAEDHGIIRADSLEEAPNAAVEDATLTIDGSGNETWVFENDAGLVSRPDGSGGSLPPQANPDYSSGFMSFYGESHFCYIL